MAKKTRWYWKNFRFGKIRVNRKYKDRLFRFLFRNKKDLLDLYNALNNSHYDNPAELEIVTLEDAIFMKMKNDMSFMIANQLNLYEHQSTYTPNMPLRGFLYFAKQYEGLVAERGDDLYGTKLIRLPTPRYVVFYYGGRKMPDSKELFLSDSFEEGRQSGCLECSCMVLNMNRGHNEELIKRCRRLWEYTEFVGEVNDNLQTAKNIEEAMLLAIDSCIRKNILTDVLVKNREEVLDMLLTEYDEEKHMRNTYREGYEEGEQAGYSKGEQAGYDKGKQAGYSEGEQAKLRAQVLRKQEKGKSLAVIAEELEEDEKIIEMLLKEINSH